LQAAAEASETFDGKPTEDELAEFARLVLVHESGVASAYVRSMREQGTALECISRLARAAALRLGELWEQKRMRFQPAFGWLESPRISDARPRFRGAADPIPARIALPRRRLCIGRSIAATVRRMGEAPPCDSR